MTYFKTLLFLIFVPGSVVLLLPYKIVQGRAGKHRLRMGGWRFSAVLPWLAGSALLIWSFWNFVVHGRGTPHPSDPPKELVAEGPYRFTRNPQYVGVMLILLGHFLWSGASILLAYSALVFTAFNTFIIFYEEPNLERRFGESYRRYLQAAPRWLG